MTWSGLKDEFKGTPETHTVSLEAAIKSAKHSADNYFPQTSSEDYDFDSLVHIDKRGVPRNEEGNYVVTDQDVILKLAQRTDGTQMFYVEAICNMVYSAILRAPECVGDIIVTITPKTDDRPVAQREEFYMVLINPKNSTAEVIEIGETLKEIQSQRPRRMPEWATGMTSIGEDAHKIKMQKKKAQRREA